MSWAISTDVVLYLTAGGALGAVYFVSLLWAVRLHASRAASIRIIPLSILRLATAVSAFWIVAQQGALPLLVTLLGFLIARLAIQHWIGSG
jgi:F1F0 ATPase subunit 2